MSAQKGPDVSTVDAFVAANRFGLGPRPGELRQIGADPRGWLNSQIDREAPPPAALRGLPTTEDMLRLMRSARMEKDRPAKRALKGRIAAAGLAGVVHRAGAATNSSSPFRERLVKFWSNHFTVSTAAKGVEPIAAAYEREAIRPHVFGRFEDMLLAVARHPAMLLYLDNATSIGPHSVAGRRSRRGLNENLAREILELHTLGVDGGYDQADVIAFAKILTGWSIGGMDRHARGDLGFRFFDRGHEPGPKILLGETYGHGGVQEGVAALRDLARHPSTARFVATKLARHFVADTPPASAVRRLEAAFRRSGGDLAAVAQALVGLPEAWADPLAKVKTPYELVISTFRALGMMGLAPKHLIATLRQLSQPPFSAPSPAGWPDRAADWIGPGALMRRIEWTRAIVARRDANDDARAFAAETIAAVARDGTLDIIARAPSAEEGVALVLASAEFQRR